MLETRIFTGNLNKAFNDGNLNTTTRGLFTVELNQYSSFIQI